MGNIRINVLARELEIKSHLILDFLEELGVEKKSHSSALEDDIADKVREHFRALGDGGEGPEVTPAPPPPALVVAIEPPPAAAEVKKLPDIIKAELQHPLTRTLEEIKNAARRGDGASASGPGCSCSERGCILCRHTQACAAGA